MVEAPIPESLPPGQLQLLGQLEHVGELDGVVGRQVVKVQALCARYTRYL